MSNPDGYYGTQLATSRTSEYNAIDFVVRSILSGRAHVALVQVIAVTPGEGVKSLGTVDVQPMVNQLDADGAPLAHGVINGIPWLTLQAGPNAVLLRPEVGDRGLCVFADRDISSVKSTREISNPGSYRQADMADGLYIGGFLNDDPTQWIKMDADGIVIHSPTLIKLEAPEIRLEAENNVAIVAPEVTIDASTSTTITTGSFVVNGNSQFNGTIDASGNITAPDGVFSGKSFNSHKHGGVQTGGGQTGTPV